MICIGCTPTFIIRDKLTNHIPDMEYEFVKETDEYIIGRIRYNYYPDTFTCYDKKDYEIIYLRNR